MLRIINEMADDLQGIKLRISSKIDMIKLHLLMIYVYPNGNIKHWEDEIYNLLNEIPRRKKKSSNYGYITKEQFLDFSWNIIEDDLKSKFKSNLRTVEYKEGRKIQIKNPNPDLFYEFVKRYLYWLAEEMTERGEDNGVVDEKQVVEEIERLRKEVLKQK